MTDRILVRRQLIQQDLERAAAGHADTWRRVTREWRESTEGNHAWLTYAANYLFSFAGYKWALDPFAMSSRVNNLAAPDYRTDLGSLSLIVLTHEHNDHLDLPLIHDLSDMDIQWVIPSYLQEKIGREVDIPADRVVTPVAGEAITTGPLKLLPFESLHMRDGKGVPETGYLVQYKDKRWLFPGDIRKYDYQQLPSFGRLDAVVAHLWLGKAHAMDDFPPLMAEFCDFFTNFETERLIITHLNEFGRDENDLWRESHFDQVKAEILRRKPDMRIEKALMGDRIDLDLTR